MKRFLIPALFLPTFLLPISLFAQPANTTIAQTTTESNQPATYTLDPMHSYVEWHIDHFGFSHPSGKWFVNGTLLLDENNPKNSKINVTIPVANFVTGIPKLDQHLQSDEFFAVAKFPMATFVSDKVELTGSNTAKVTGNLTVHGVTKSITLDVTLNKIGVNPLLNKKVAGFRGTTVIKRSDFGINAYLPNLGDEVNLNFEVEADLAN